MSKRRSLLYIAICLLIVLVGCGNNMRDQARCQPLEANTFFDDGKCARGEAPLDRDSGIGDVGFRRL